MATIKYILQSKSENAPIYLRLSLDKNKSVKRRIGLYINPKEWSSPTGLPKQTNSKNKNLITDLRDLREFILKEINKSSSKGEGITGDWLAFKIDVYFERISESKQSEYITDAIQVVKEKSKLKKNGKGGIGLSKSRINAYTNLNNLIENFQKAKKHKIKDVNLKFGNDFLKFLIDDESYGEKYAIKKLSDLKTVCYSAESDGIKVNPQFKKIPTPSIENDYIIYLTPDELKKVENLDIINKSLNNARRWLLLGCNIGQRGGDLLSLTTDNFINRGGLDVIELKQEKGSANITIPVLGKTREIFDEGLPYKISIQKFNKYAKKVCLLAEINEQTEGLLYDKEIKRKKLGIYEKWKLIGSHVCRRSFATNNYGILPTPLLMRITGHKTEKMFLKYIGKNSLDYAQQIADFYTLQALKDKKEPKLTVVRSASE